MMHIYINDTLIPKMSQGMPNGTTKAKLLGNYSLTLLCQQTVLGCLIKIGFVYNYAVNKKYLVGY